MQTLFIMLSRELQLYTKKQAEAELCQAQFKLGLAKPTVASPPPIESFVS